MKKTVYQLLIAMALFAVNASGQDVETSVRYRVVRTSMIIVPIQLNGSAETLEFLLDTGTNSTVIVPDIAVRHRLRPVDRIEMVTPAGTVITPRSFASSISLGDRSAENVEVLWSDLPELRRLDKRISGILGQNFLSQFNFTIHLRYQRIIFGDGDETESSIAGRIPFELVEGRIVLKLATDEAVVRFVLDSGAEGLMLFSTGCRKLARNIERSEQLMQVSSNAGTGVIRTGSLRVLRLGGKDLRDLQVVLLDRVDRIEDGLLPLSLFHSVFFNNREKYVRLSR